MSKTRCSYDIVDIVSILSILCRYRTYISIIRNRILRRPRFDTISSFNCWLNCIAVDIDTISSCCCWIKCFAIDIVDIIDTDTISFRNCWMSCIAVDIVDINLISIRYRFMLGSAELLSVLSISIRYRYDIVS